jgi:hypothetical protein
MVIYCVFQGHSKMGDWPTVIRSAQIAIAQSLNTANPSCSISHENQMITCLSQVCHGAGVIYKSKILYNIGVAAFTLSYLLDVWPHTSHIFYELLIYFCDEGSCQHSRRLRIMASKHVKVSQLSMKEC